MKSLVVSLSFILQPSKRRNLLALGKLLLVFVTMVVVFSTIFQILMQREGQSHSIASTIYWVLVTMSTLGFGDITFRSDAGRLFSVAVLLSGSVFMLVLLPFMFIQFFYVPWMEAQAAARAPTELPADTRRHVILTSLGIVERALVRLFKRAQIPYVILVGELSEALRLHDEGFSVMLGAVDDRSSYERARANAAAMVVAAQRDTTNTNVAFTVREFSPTVSIVATASSPASVDILELAGCNQVLQLGEMLGQALARRVLGRDARTHVVGAFGELLIAEASAAGTPLVGRTLRDIKLYEHTRTNVVGIWDRGRFTLAGPETRVEPWSVLLLSGTRADLDEYDALFCVYGKEESSVIIIGGGRVGRAAGRELLNKDIEYHIIDHNPQRIRNPQHYVLGDAAELEVLERAGIRDCSTVIITSHDDDVNVYLSIYCRKLRPDAQILVRANQDRNVSTLHRAGADFVMSYASMGSSNIYNLLRRGNLLLLTDGLDAFKVPVPSWLVGKSLAESQFRQVTGCNVVGIEENGLCQANPNPHMRLTAGLNLIVVGDAEAEDRFFAKHAD
ncbi:MAG: NAD-binding protein [Pirellulaceae bacterium]|nr:NAD-binding protein [Pirellulaceae bacterium]